MARSIDGLAMQQPTRFLLRMVIFLGLAVLAVAAVFPVAAEAYMANPVLNGLILGVLAFGIFYSFRQVLLLVPEVRWVNAFRRTDPGRSPVTSEHPVLLAPMAMMLSERSGPVSLSATSTRSILDSVEARLDESRDLGRYMTGLLIFLGLLGTFWGLILVVSSIADTIRALPDSGAGELAFAELRKGLEAPLSGMGTAFSSSLFGLAGSLILGFLDLQTGQAQNRFYNKLEEWLSAVTRLGSAVEIGSGDASVPAYVGALLEQTAENLERLERTLGRLEERRGSGDDVTREIATQLRNLDATMRMVAEQSTRGHSDLVAELRQEIKLMTKTLASLAAPRS